MFYCKPATNKTRVINSIFDLPFQTVEKIIDTNNVFGFKVDPFQFLLTYGNGRT